MSLVVDKIKSVEESDEVGADDIYLIVFEGRTVPPFDAVLNSVGPGTAWSDFDTGETHNADVRIGSTNGDSLYAVMMVEKDRGKDVTGAAVVGAWRSATDLAWKTHMGSLLVGGLPTNTERAKIAGFGAIKNTLYGLSSVYMEFPKGDDDVLDVQRVIITTPGQSQTIRFRSNVEDATYDVTFKQTTAP